MIRMYDVIAKKRDGHRLSEEEIRAVVRGCTSGEIPDYQISAWLMAVYLRGMDAAETTYLTDAMLHSGDMVDLSAFGTLSADKHSTGGVGDKTTLIVAPLAAAMGCRVAKMSGRGLGHTGGTIDKLEAIPGYRTALTPDEFHAQVEKIGVSVIGATGTIAPADKLLYALRDVTATVESIPLIASSIMSKKLAAGASSIVLDVTVGSGAFMKNTDDARVLARLMVEIGTRCGKRVTAVLSDMDQPLGRAVGNALELAEAISLLGGQSEGLEDLLEVSLVLAAQMAANVFGLDPQTAYEKAYETWRSGAAYETFLAWIAAQGGELSFVTQPQTRPTAPYRREIHADCDGYLYHADAERIGIAAMMLGAGRRTKDDVIDPTAGICMEKKVGDAVTAGEVLAVLHTSDACLLGGASALAAEAMTISAEKPPHRPHIIDVIDSRDAAGDGGGKEI